MLLYMTSAEYRLHPELIAKMFLAHRYIHPEGLPSDYTITMLFRLLPNTPEEPFALWEILNKNNEPLVGVILDSESDISAMGTECTKHQDADGKTSGIICEFVDVFVHLPADGGKTLTFFNNDYKGEFQTVTFEGPEIKKLFYGSFHKVRTCPVLCLSDCRSSVCGVSEPDTET